MKWLKGILITLAVIFLQVFLIDKLPFLGICHPFVYVYLLLLLPIELPRWSQLFIAAALGLVMDTFSNSPGVHTAACIMFAYLRPLFLERSVQDMSRLTGPITRDSVGNATFLQVLAMLVAVHHVTLFMLDAFTFRRFWMTLILTVLSSIATFGLILMADIFRKANE